MIQPSDLHICIATEQNVANLIPALQYQAKEVWILETPEMHKEHSGRYLSDALKAHEVNSKLIPFPSDGIETMMETVDQIAIQLESADRLPIINITGGTKLMTLTLVQGLAAMLETSDMGIRVPLVYTDTQNQRLEWIQTENSVDDMQPVLELVDFLRVYGYHIKSTRKNNKEVRAKHLDIARDREHQTNEMAGAAHRFRHAISALNGAASKAANELESSRSADKLLIQRFDFKGAKKPELEYFSKLEDNGLLEYRQAQQQVEFMTEEAARYCAGGWLEEFVALKAEKAEINGSWDYNLEVQTAELQTPNEIDLMVVHNNRALVVECKTARPESGVAQGWLTRLGNLARRVGGRQATPMLVSTHKLAEPHVKRAQDLGVLLCHGPEVQHFARYLYKWLNS